jgi:hypothetical protein
MPVMKDRGHYWVRFPGCRWEVARYDPAWSPTEGGVFWRCGTDEISYASDAEIGEEVQSHE